MEVHIPLVPGVPVATPDGPGVVVKEWRPLYDDAGHGGRHDPAWLIVELDAGARRRLFRADALIPTPGVRL